MFVVLTYAHTIIANKYESKKSCTVIVLKP